ncbi:hypothetical protein ACQKO5_22930 [Novosphingobium subterraneum]|uniref:hypothetical protein n=1 Tax=Novosphingobium subterraneum TaxID=48936 RepID=UPI003CFEF3D5
MILSPLTFTPIQSFLNQQSDEVALPHLSSQSVDPILRPRASAKVEGFIKDARLGHPRRHSGIAFSQPVPNHMIDE